MHCDRSNSSSTVPNVLETLASLETELEESGEMTHPQNPHFTAAEGYYALNMIEEAHAELDLAAEDQDLRMEVVRRRMELFILDHRWPEAADLGQTLCELEPEDGDHFINYSYALHGLGEHKAAVAALLIGPRSLLSDPGYHYSLGTYEASVGKFIEALHHLRKAIAIEPTIHTIVLKDSLFKPIHKLLGAAPAPAPFIPTQSFEDPF